MEKWGARQHSERGRNMKLRHYAFSPLSFFFLLHLFTHLILPLPPFVLLSAGVTADETASQPQIVVCTTFVWQLFEHFLGVFLWQ
jgi:hypothetical protein